VKLGFLVLYIDISFLSFRIPVVIDVFLFELMHLRFLANHVFVHISGLPDFDFISLIKCKSENRRVRFESKRMTTMIFFFFVTETKGISEN